MNEYEKHSPSLTQEQVDMIKKYQDMSYCYIAKKIKSTPSTVKKYVKLIKREKR